MAKRSENKAKTAQDRSRSAKAHPAGFESAPKAQDRPKRVLSLTATRVRKLGLDFASIVDAAAHLGRRYDLAKLLTEHAELAAAWSRGQFLRNVQALAATGASVAEAANRLGLAADDLQGRLASDLELANIWNQARLNTAIELKAGWLAKAKEGNARAMAQVEIALANEIARAAMDIHTVPEHQMCQIAGVTRQTLNRWLREEAMPRNAGETTYDLPAVWAWHETFTKKRCGTASGAGEPDRLRDVKAERLELELAARKGELVSVESVKAGILARERALLAVLEHLPEQYSHPLAGRTEQEVRRILEQLCRDLTGAWCRAIEQATGDK